MQLLEQTRILKCTRIIKYTFFAVAALCIGLAFFLISYHPDRSESFYPSLSDAVKDGAIDRGWIPDDLLPTSSRSIHEIHDLSPSTEWCAFEFLPTDSQKLITNLKHVDSVPASLKRVPNPGVSWWPPVLSGNLNAKRIRKMGFVLYMTQRPATSVTTETWLFAIDWAKGRGFFYSR
jgi:hypothetical protein